MIKFPLSLLCIALLSTAATAQLDTSGGRYCSQIFNNVTVTSNVTYGSAVKSNGQTQTLLMDIYQPTGDTVSRRPLIVLAHGGSFIGGVKTNQDVVELCNRFAKHGYVTASIEYRVGFFPFDSVNATRAVIRATQDMKAAIRFFRKDAATTKTYKIHPSYIFAGGSSAGAFMALHHAYMDKLSEVPTWANIATLGGIDGNSGNPGYQSDVNAVINLCGALGDSVWIEQGNIPFVSMHGDKDQTVPYGSAIIYVSGFPIINVDGSASLKKRADNLGVPNPFYTFWGADHVPFAGTSATNIAYMDTTVSYVRNFLCPLLLQASLTGTETESGSMFDGVNLFPNPANGLTCISWKQASEADLRITVFDIAGREVKELFADRYSSGLHRESFNTSQLQPGIYFVSIRSAGASALTQKLVVR